MKKIEVLGPGCNNCMRLEKNTRAAVALAGIDAEITKVGPSALQHLMRA